MRLRALGPRGVRCFLLWVFILSIALGASSAFSAVPPSPLASFPAHSAGLSGLAPSTSPSGDLLFLALKFVAFKQKDGSPVVNPDQVSALVRKLNSIFQSCRIQFQFEKFIVVAPSDFGLPMSPPSVDEMYRFRKPFDDKNYLVIIHTADWEHQRLGPPNAWTAMPGETPSGAVIERKVAGFAEMVAHELGHYLSLDHVKDERNVMSPMIFGKSNQLLPQQCAEIRATALKSRKGAIRYDEGGRPTANLIAEYSG